MTDFADLSSDDLRAARILCGLSIKAVAANVGVSAPAISRLESEGLKRSETRFLYATFLARMGVKFGNPGQVSHPRYGRAPTVVAAGAVTGPRLRRAREALRLQLADVAAVLKSSESRVRYIERMVDPLSGGTADHACLMFNMLEAQGFEFHADPREDRRTPGHARV